MCIRDRGKENVRNFLKGNPDVANEIEDKILIHLGLREAEVPEGVDPQTGEVEF